MSAHDTDTMESERRDDPVIETNEGAVLRIKVTPKARKPGVLGSRAGWIAVAVTAAPERGKATEEAVARITGWLGLRPSAARLVSGAASRDKRLIFPGLTASDLRKRLDEAAGRMGF